MKKIQKTQKSAQNTACYLNLRPRKIAPVKVLQSLIGATFFGRLLAVTMLAGSGLVAFSDAAAQVSPPSTGDISPTVNTDVSSLIQTGCGYDAWTGSVRRPITDLEVPGAVSSLGLKWVRTYNSASHDVNGGWNFSWTWLYWGRGWPDPTAVRLPDGGIWRYADPPIEPGNKLRFWRSCTGRCTQGYAFLTLEDGSQVHMNFTVDHTCDTCGPIDLFKPDYVDDPYGRRTTLDWENAMPDYPDLNRIRLQQVTDPSGRWIRITYACDPNDPNHPCTNFNWWRILRVDGSNGSWVTYQPDASMPTHVDYSDGTSADYTYNNTTYFWYDPSCSCYHTGQATKLITAQDTHADCPMQSIRYEYASATNLNDPQASYFEGRIRAEHHLASDVEVSRLTCDSQCPVKPTSHSATVRETRSGEGPYRTLFIQKDQDGNGRVPLVKTKSDFNGINEVFTYDSNNYLHTAQDRNNHTTTFYDTNYTEIGNPTQILHPDQTHIDYAYSDPSNPYHVHTVSDELQKMTTYTRDGNNRITQIDYPTDIQTPAAHEYFPSYNNFGQVLTHQLRNGAVESFAYTTGGIVGGLLTDRWNPQPSPGPSPSDPHIHYDYYGPNDPVAGNAWIDRLKMVTLPANFCGDHCSYQATETYEYDRALAGGLTDPNGTPVTGRGLVTKITHGAVNTNYNTYQSFGYDAYGNKRWEENELRQRTTYTYDDYKRVLTVTNPLNKTTTSDYAPSEGDPTQCYQHTSNSPYWITTPALIKTHNLYDGNWCRTSTTAAYGTLNLMTTFGYDNVGNLTSATNPRDFQTQHVYDPRNRKTSTTEAYGTNLQRTTTWHYDAANNIYQIDRPDQTQEIKTYDAVHRVLTDTVPKSANPAVNIVTTFNYNPSGTLNWVRDGEGHTYNFTYDAADRKLSMTYPSTGGPPSTQSWVYDDAGNMKWRITAGGEGKVFYYDYRNRNYATWWSNWNNNIVDWRYLGYDDASRLIEAENGTGGWGANVISDVIRYYDAAGHLTLEQQKVIGVGTAVAVNYPTYDDDGRLTRMYVTAGGVPLTLGAGYDFTYSYDAMGRFEKIFLTNSSQLFQYYYDAASNEIERDNLNNGVKQIYPRDALNRMQYMDVKHGNDPPLGHEGYSYAGPDGAMNRLTSVDYGNQHSDVFGYYLDGELNTAQLGNFNRSVTYTLNNAGDRTSVLDTNVTTTYSPNAINEYTAVTPGHTICNGLEHEISCFDSVSYSYINDERLSTVTSGSNTYNLVYDALGRCVKRTLNGLATYYLYDGEKPILEVDGNSGNEVAVNVYGKGIDEILERVAVGSDNQWYTYFLQQNHEGSVTHLTAPTTGSVIEQYRYDVFGAPTIYGPNWGVRPSTAYDNRFLFTGREYAATYRSTHNTPALNFYEYRARAYNPTLGRFMNEDPKVFDAGDYNLFRYCHNDPVDMTDPMGLSWNETEPPPSFTDQAQGLQAQFQRQQNQGTPLGVIGFSPREGDVSRANNYQLTMAQMSQQLSGVKTFTSWQAAGREGGSVASPQAVNDPRHHERYGYLGQGVNDAEIYTRGPVHEGNAGPVNDSFHRPGEMKNRSYYEPKRADLPAGFRPIGIYYAYAYHQSGFEAADVANFRKYGIKAVLANPPSIGAQPPADKVTFWYFPP